MFDDVHGNMSEEEEDPLFNVAVGYFSTRFTIVLGFMVALTVVNVILFLSVVCSKALPPVIKLILANIIVANELLIVTLFLVSMSEIIELYYEPFGEAWRVFYIAMCSAAAGRLLFMAVYAVIVYVMARYAGTSKDLALVPVIIAVVVVWILATIPNFIHYLTFAAHVNVPVGALCSAHNQVTFDLDYLLISLGIYGIVGFFVCIPVLGMTIYHLKAHNKEIRKGLVKFSAFLLLGNITHFLGIMLPLLFSLFDDEDCYGFLIGIDTAGLVILLASLFVTPIIILVLFKTIWTRFKGFMCCSCVCNTEAPNTAETVQTEMHTYGDF